MNRARTPAGRCSSLEPITITKHTVHGYHSNFAALQHEAIAGCITTLRIPVTYSRPPRRGRCERGNGPPVVLIHGNAVTGNDWNTSGVAALLARNHRVIILNDPASATANARKAICGRRRSRQIY
jgi:hypothetical protein